MVTDAAIESRFVLTSNPVKHSSWTIFGLGSPGGLANYFREFKQLFFSSLWCNETSVSSSAMRELLFCLNHSAYLSIVNGGGENAANCIDNALEGELYRNMYQL
jgi:hypothetical protein